MNIFILPGEGPDWSGYLEAMLRARGLAYAQIIQPNEFRSAGGEHSVLLCSPGGDARCLFKDLQGFLASGGCVIVFMPGPALRQLAGLEDLGENPGPTRLRMVRPAALGARGQTLPIPAISRRYQVRPQTTVWGLLYVPGDPASQTPGIIEHPSGHGRLFFLAYDLPRTVFLLRQGDPGRAGYVPPSDTVQRPSHLFPPQEEGDGWLPAADLHVALLCDLIRTHIERAGPVPSFSHVPRGKSSVLIYSGDEDGGDLESNDSLMKELEHHGGAMTLNIIPDQTHTTVQHIQEYTRRGHTISVHPNLYPARLKDISGQIRQAADQVALFQQKFAHPTRTVRNHMTIWPGFTDVPELWRQVGIRMDTNYFASRLCQSPQVNPYSGPSAGLPLPFARPDGSLLPVWQQPTQIADDLWFHPTVDYSMKISPSQFEQVGRRMFEDSSRFFHAPLCVCIHPVNYTHYSGEQGRALMRLAREFDWPILSVDQWLAFWEARDTWRISGYRIQDGELSLTCSGKPMQDLFLLFPARHRGRTLFKVCFSGREAEIFPCQRFQEDCFLTELPSRTDRIDVVAHYA